MGEGGRKNKESLSLIRYKGREIIEIYCRKRKTKMGLCNVEGLQGRKDVNLNSLCTNINKHFIQFLYLNIYFFNCFLKIAIIQMQSVEVTLLYLSLKLPPSNKIIAHVCKQSHSVCAPIKGCM